MNPAPDFTEPLVDEVAALRARIRELEQAESHRTASSRVQIDESQFAGIISVASDAIISVDESLQIVLFNHGAETIFGYDGSEVIGEPLDMLLPTKFRNAHREDVKRFTASPVSARWMAERQEISGLRKSGEQFPAEASISKMQHDGRWLFTVVLRDITERKQAEEERHRLLVAEQAARAKAESAMTALDRVQSVTDVALQHLGLDDLLDELMARIRDCLNAETAAILLLTEDRSELSVRASHGLAIVPGTEVLVPLGRGVSGRVAESLAPMIVEDLVHGPDISPVLRDQGIQSMVAAPLIVEDRIIGVVHVGARIPRHFTDDDLKLLQLVADRIALAIEHARLYHEAQKAIRMRDEVLAFTSHDLKNLVAAIRLRVQLLQTMLESPTTEVERSTRELASVEATAEKMMALIEELLDLARLQLGRPLPLDPRPTDLVSLAQDVVDEYQRVTKKHEIHLKTCEQALVGWWDTERLDRVLRNLLDNAVKYSPSGGPISVTVDNDGQGSAVLTVRDHGVGIPATDLPRIFERFRRGTNVVGRIKGTGIGLSGARQILDQHGGSIVLSSEEGVGTLVTVRLPLPVTS